MIHPEKAVSSVCSAKREDALGMELMRMKPLFSPAPCGAGQGSGIPSAAPPSLGTSWPAISLSVASSLASSIPSSFQEAFLRPAPVPCRGPPSRPAPRRGIWLSRRVRLDLHLPLTVSYTAVLPGVPRTSGHVRHCVLFPCFPRS